MPLSTTGCARAASPLPLSLLALSLLAAPAATQHAATPQAQPDAPTLQPVLMLGRVASPRQVLAKQDPVAVAMLEQGLKWLLAQQDKDGRWNADQFMGEAAQGDAEVRASMGTGRATLDAALTGLVVFALSREGVAKRTDPQHTAILRGVHWLAQQQNEAGVFAANAGHDFIYGHAIATLGMWAATAATGSAEARTAAEKGYEYLEKHRNPYSVWRYQPRDNDNDTSVTTWATLAYLAAHEQNHKINRAATNLIGVWIDQVSTPDGRVGYTKRGEPSSRNVRNAERFPPQHGEAMTAAGLLCWSVLGRSAKDHPVTQKSADLLLAKKPTWEPKEGKVDHCYWFFATEAFRHFDGDGKQEWAQALVDALQKGQRADGAYGGSWDPIDPWGEDGGRIYSTALSVLALQGLYPLRDAPKPAAK